MKSVVSVRLNAKETVEKHCALVGKVFSHRGKGLTILIMLSMYIGIDYLSSGWRMVGTKFLTVEIGGYRQAGRKG